MDLQTLADLNVEMGAKEDARDVAYFRELLAPELAMRRANGQVVGREQFLQALASPPAQPGTDTRTTEIESVTLLGASRALVTCVVALGGRRFHNLRIFVRAPAPAAGQWRLLAWANEPIG